MTFMLQILAAFRGLKCNLVLFLILTGLLSGQSKMVEAFAKDSTELYHGKNFLGKSKGIVAIKNDDQFFEVRTVKEGTLPQNHVFVSTKYGLKRVETLMNGEGNGKLFSGKIYLPTNVLLPPRKEVSQKYVYTTDAEVHFQKDDSLLSFFSYRNRSFDKKPYRVIPSLEDNDFELHSQQAGNELLATLGYADTAHSFFRSYRNTLCLKAEISGLRTHVYETEHHMAVIVRAQITWKLMDIYKTVLESYKSEVFSDAYKILRDGQQSKVFMEVFVNNMLKGVLQKSLIAVLKDPNTVKLLEIPPSKEEPLSVLEIAKPSIPANNMESLQDCIPTIKTKHGHGSGIVINEEGYLVTNYHVIANSEDSISIVFKNGSRHAATLLRKNLDKDLALLKINLHTKAVSIKSGKYDDSWLGNYVYAIGTPYDTIYAQSITRGVISAKRTFELQDYIQSDVSVSPGNSGGGLALRDGSIIGMVSSKLVNYDIEGISFSITAEKVFEGLNLIYK